ncbi:MAG: LPXTG cell wall anchor domain-containing protein [Anaerolineae bacterium]|nr:LPXTG cell wall anchor domain-containing protein [Anaerolineae bacterium]
MAKSARSASGAIRRLLLVIAATGITVAGLALLAGGGYMLIAAPANTNPAPLLSQVSAQEPTATTAPAPDPLDQRSVEVAVDTVPDLVTDVPAPTLQAAQVFVPTATRVVRATATPTPEPATELPDTGFGSILQPLAGFALVGVAFTAHALRRRS